MGDGSFPAFDGLVFLGVIIVCMCLTVAYFRGDPRSGGAR